MFHASQPQAPHADSSFEGMGEVIEFRKRAEVRAAPLQAACFTCRARSTCLPRDVGEPALHDLDGAVLDQRRVGRGHALYREGERFQDLYAVRTGTFKLSVTLGDGREHVSRIAMQGDLLGLDGIARGTCGATAVALEDSEVCRVSFSTLHDLASRRSAWQQSLCRVMAEEISRELQHLVVLGSAGTESRVASFLLELSDRFRQRGYSGSEFHLRLSRAEIGSYLGLTLETISRTLSAFQQHGWIEVHKRHIRLLAMDALGEAAGTSRPSQARLA
jgi:CRP/FNR family transcriptional regulator